MVRARIVVYTDDYAKLTGSWQFTEDAKELASVVRNGMAQELNTLLTDQGAVVFRTADVTRVYVEKE